MAFATASHPAATGVGVTIAAVPLDLSSGRHNILVTGQAQIGCVGCVDNDDVASVSLTVVDDDGTPVTIIGPYQVDLTSSRPTVFVPFSGGATLLRTDPAATHNYRLVATMSFAGATPPTAVNFTNAQVNAVDLGR